MVNENAATAAAVMRNHFVFVIAVIEDLPSDSGRLSPKLVGAWRHLSSSCHYSDARRAKSLAGIEPTTPIGQIATFRKLFHYVK
jgi:hypothetical protein